MGIFRQLKRPFQNADKQTTALVDRHVQRHADIWSIATKADTYQGPEILNKYLNKPLDRVANSGSSYALMGIATAGMVSAIVAAGSLASMGILAGPLVAAGSSTLGWVGKKLHKRKEHIKVKKDLESLAALNAELSAIVNRLPKNEPLKAQLLDDCLNDFTKLCNESIEHSLIRSNLKLLQGLDGKNVDKQKSRANKDEVLDVASDLPTVVTLSALGTRIASASGAALTGAAGALLHAAPFVGLAGLGISLGERAYSKYITAKNVEESFRNQAAKQLIERVKQVRILLDKHPEVLNGSADRTQPGIKKRWDDFCTDFDKYKDKKLDAWAKKLPSAKKDSAGSSAPETPDSVESDLPIPSEDLPAGRSASETPDSGKSTLPIPSEDLTAAVPSPTLASSSKTAPVARQKAILPTPADFSPYSPTAREPYSPDLLPLPPIRHSSSASNITEPLAGIVIGLALFNAVGIGMLTLFAAPLLVIGLICGGTAMMERDRPKPWVNRSEPASYSPSSPLK